jgi:hypothetical protein
MKNQSHNEKEEARRRREMWLSVLNLFELTVILGPPSGMRIPVYYHEQNLN